MFLSGVDQRSCELRAASVRGAMRYWYRALLGGRGLPLNEVRRREAEVFGEAGREGGAGGSAVSLRVTSTGLRDSCRPPSELPAWDNKPSGNNPQGKIKPSAGIGYLWFSVALGSNFRSFIAPGTQFEVVIAALPGREQAFGEALKAFWLLSHLGALGTRSRRAAGSFWVIDTHIEGTDSPLFKEFFDPQEVGHEIKNMIGSKDVLVSPTLNQYSVLGDNIDIFYRKIEKKSWKDAIDCIGSDFKKFRFENRRCPDPERAGFGLPLTVGYRRDERKIMLSSQEQVGEGRRGSPLHIRVVPNKEKKLDALYVLMGGRFGPEGDRLVSVYKGGRRKEDNLPDMSLVKKYLNTIPDTHRIDLL